MAFGPKRCACCGSSNRVAAYYLNGLRGGGSNELTIWLCAVCHDQTGGLEDQGNVVLIRQNAPSMLRFKQGNLPVTWIKASESNRNLATVFAAGVLPIIHQLEANGVTSYRAIAAALNAKGVKTARGGEWQSTTVGSMLRRKSC